MTSDDLEYLKEKGVKRIHHNLETSKNYYSFICSTQTWESRLNTIQEALDSGFEVCAGGLFGMGETWSDRIELAIALREHFITNIPINFLVPHEKTPLSGIELLKSEEALKIIAVFRLLMPNATLRICGGRRMILGKNEKEIFKAGANAFMTGNYLTALGNNPDEDLKMIQNLGMEVAKNE